MKKFAQVSALTVLLAACTAGVGAPEIGTIGGYENSSGGVEGSGTPQTGTAASSGGTPITDPTGGGDTTPDAGTVTHPEAGKPDTSSGGTDSGGGSGSAPTCETYYTTCCPNVPGQTTSSCDTMLNTIHQGLASSPSSGPTYESSCKSQLSSAQSAGYCG